MAAARNSQRENTPTEQNKEDNTLVLYRLTLVEQAVKDLGTVMAAKENITRADLVEFKEAIFERFAEKTTNLQEQINDLEKNKASQSSQDDIKSLIKWVAAVGSTVISGLVLFYFTKQ